MTQERKNPPYDHEGLTYRAYLLRLWAESGANENHTWRFSLEKVGSSERQGFADLGSLAAFLKKETAQS